MLGEKFTFP